VYEIETDDRRAVRPATRKIGRTVDPVIERACEMKIVRNERLDRLPVFVEISPVARSRERR
jgi:hypothetical protein